MKNGINVVLTFISGLLIISSVFAESRLLTLSLTTYNAMNLSGKHGVSLFPERSYAREERDFTAIRKYLLATDADIILLQEISDLAALKEILPSQYSFMLDPSHVTDPAPHIDTAIAFNPQRVRLTGFAIMATGIEYEEAGQKIKTRDSIGIRAETDLGQVWIFSVHLKSSCSQKKLSQGGEANSCVILEKQLHIIKNHVNSIREKGEAVILGGDFNRRGLPDYLTDAYLSIIQPEYSGARLVKPGDRRCPTFAGKDRHPIDFFLLYGMENVNFDINELVFRTQDIEAGYKLSDHCPVMVSFRPS